MTCQYPETTCRPCLFNVGPKSQSQKMPCKFEPRVEFGVQKNTGFFLTSGDLIWGPDLDQKCLHKLDIDLLDTSLKRFSIALENDIFPAQKIF